MRKNIMMAETMDGWMMVIILSVKSGKQESEKQGRKVVYWNRGGSVIILSGSWTLS